MRLMLEESPVCIECKVVQVLELGTHDMFIANVAAGHADEQYLDETGRFDLNQAKPLSIPMDFIMVSGKRLENSVIQYKKSVIKV